MCDRRGPDNLRLGQWEGGDPESWALWEVKEAAEAKRRSSNGSNVMANEEEELKIDEAEVAALRQKMAARPRRGYLNTVSHCERFEAIREIGTAKETSEAQVEHERAWTA